MKIAIAQINCTVGDLAGNAAKIADYAQRARQQGAAILLTPELSLCGYPPDDLLLRDGFYQACDTALLALAQQAQGITLIVGHPHKVGKSRFNAASVLRDGKIVTTYHKHALPNHSVFDEERYFDHGSEACLIEMDGVKFGINVCADVWHEHAAIRAKEAGAQVLLVLNASPYHFNKQATRYDTVRERIVDTGLAVVYANMVGGQDELVFDGASFVMDNEGELTHQLPAFDEVLGFVEFQDGKLVPGRRARLYPEEPFSRRVAGIVRRHRLCADHGGGSGRAGRGQSARGHDAVALYRADKQR
jgi:predicted amidohydrolase